MIGTITNKPKKTMNFTLTLIGSLNQSPLNEGIINKAIISLEKQSARIEGLTWLSKDEACDITFYSEQPNHIITIASPGIDHIIQASDNRKKTILISDMDSTIIEQECIDELADTLGIKDQVSDITAKAMNNELNFTESLIARVALLKGLEKSKLNDVYEKHITLTPGAKTLVQTMKKHGAYTILVSGGFTFFTEKISQSIGFDEHHANTLLFENGTLTGQVAEPILDKDSKLMCLNQSCQTQQCTADHIISVGDGANDLPMLLAAGIGIAYHASPNVQDATSHHINHTNLTSLLYLQGYRKDEFVD